MKNFDLEKVKKGAKVCTRDGREARILTTDLVNSDKPICAAVTSKDINGVPYEYVLQYYKDGFLSHWKKVGSEEAILDPRPEDLMMVEDNSQESV